MSWLTLYAIRLYRDLDGRMRFCVVDRVTGDPIMTFASYRRALRACRDTLP